MAKPDSIWPEQTQAKSAELHSLLKIGDRDWHRLKSQSNRRAAELLAAALVQLTQEGSPEDVAALTNKRLDGSKETSRIPVVRATKRGGDRRVEADFHDGSNEHHQNIDESETSHVHAGHPQTEEAQRHEPLVAIHSLILHLPNQPIGREDSSNAELFFGVFGISMTHSIDQCFV